MRLLFVHLIDYKDTSPIIVEVVLLGQVYIVVKLVPTLADVADLNADAIILS